MTAEGGQAFPGTRKGACPEAPGAKIFPDDVVEAWAKRARDLKKDDRWRTDYWFKAFPKGYFMYERNTGEALVYYDPLDLADDDEGRTEPGEAYLKLFAAGLISPDPEAKLDENGESWLYWRLK